MTHIGEKLQLSIFHLIMLCMDLSPAGKCTITEKKNNGKKDDNDNRHNESCTLHIKALQIAVPLFMKYLEIITLTFYFQGLLKQQSRIVFSYNCRTEEIIPLIGLFLQNLQSQIDYGIAVSGINIRSRQFPIHHHPQASVRKRNCINTSQSGMIEQRTLSISYSFDNPIGHTVIMHENKINWLSLILSDNLRHGPISTFLSPVSGRTRHQPHFRILFKYIHKSFMTGLCRRRTCQSADLCHKSPSFKLSSDKNSHDMTHFIVIYANITRISIGITLSVKKDNRYTLIISFLNNRSDCFILIGGYDQHIYLFINKMINLIYLFLIIIIG